ncbi:MAG: hypothetical protein R2701_01035 [Acidimicrobiales bacterium]
MARAADPGATRRHERGRGEPCVPEVDAHLGHALHPHLRGLPHRDPAARDPEGVEAPLGIAIGSFAIVCDTFTIRRFFAADHKYRWYFSAIALSIIGLLFVLLAEDIVALFR